jgi:peptidoglycan/xylan/chitin deacetylase (PgdA/CDA1 family)
VHGSTATKPAAGRIWSVSSNLNEDVHVQAKVADWLNVPVALPMEWGPPFLEMNREPQLMSSAQPTLSFREIRPPGGPAGRSAIPRGLALLIAAVLVVTPVESAIASRAVHSSGVTITSPGDGSRVTGKVNIAASAPAGTTSVTFDRSRDGGNHWTVIAADSTPDNGWDAVWDTGKFAGTALIRARATTVLGDESATITVRVDNVRPKIVLKTSHHAFSPNGDGRYDKLNVKVRATERVIVKVMAKNSRGSTIRVWNLKRALRRHSFKWVGRAHGSQVSDGRFRLKAVATDRAGLRDSGSRVVVVDTKAPKVKLEWARPEPLRNGSHVTVRYALRDRSNHLKLHFRVEGDSATRIIDAGRHSPGTRTIGLRFREKGRHLLRTGLYHLRAVGIDRAGNVGVSRTPRPWRVLRAGRAHVYRRLEGVGHKVALTFDDCYDTAGWERILEILHSHHTHATFFCNTIHVAAHPRLAKKTVRWGNAIGAHTPRHDLLTSLSADATERQLRSDIATWWRVAKATPAPYFRPPYGAYNGTVLAGAGAAANTRVVLWDIDTQDWALPGSSVVASRALQARPGSIVLMHAISQTAGAVPRILEGLRSRGLSPVTVPQLFSAATRAHSLHRSESPQSSWRGIYLAQRAAEFSDPPRPHPGLSSGTR